MKILRSSLSTLIYFGIRSQGKKQRGVRILCYHRVSDEKRDYMTVPVSKFREQMNYLKDHGYETVSLDVIASDQRERSNLKHGIASLPAKVLWRAPRNDGDMKQIIITFDDGYQDNYANAFPIMKEFGFKGIIFCVANEIGREGYLQKEEIKEMTQSGFEFGSHTFSHHDLPSLKSREKWHEINDSKSFLSKELHLDIGFFCYPRGLYDQDSVALVKEAGYLCACSNQPGTNNGRSNPFLLKRTEVAPHDSVFDFEKKLAGAYDWMHQVLHLVRGKP